MDFAHQGWQAHFDAAGCLCARITLPGTLLHPQLRRTTFFNQVLLHHPACLDPEVREALAFAIGDGKMPREVHFGDGTPIPAEWIEVILNTSQALAVAFPWCVGDLLVIDNLRMAHARRPYDGMRHHHSMLGDLCN
jgi:hypothetical protein